MRITSVIVIVATTGCAALDVEDDQAVQTSTNVAAVSGVCALTRTAIGPVLTTGELAASRASNGLYVAWTGTTSQPASIVKLDAQFGIVDRWNLGEVGPNLNGTLDLGTHALAAYGANSSGIVDMWQFTADLSIANYFATYAGNPARHAFLSNPSGSERAYLWSFGNTLILSDMDDTGFAGGGSMNDQTGTITKLSGDVPVSTSGQDSVAVWIEDLGGGSLRCSAGNVGFGNPAVPNLHDKHVVSTDCRNARIAAGPSDDIHAVVTQTAAGAINVHLRRSGADIVRTVSNAGRAPKVVFAGSRFWIVWRENGVANLRIAMLDPIGNLTMSTTPGPAVSGDESWDLARVSTSTAVLVALTPSTLELASLCL